MTQSDDKILEFLSQKEIMATPGVIAANLDYNSNWISERCALLAREGLLEKATGSNYEISDLGKQYLTGDLAAEELEPGPD